MWGVPEDETLSWGWGRRERGRSALGHGTGLAALSPPHQPLAAAIHNPPPLPLCKEDEGPAMSAPGGTKGGQSGHRHRPRGARAHAHMRSHSFIQQTFIDVLVSQATERNQERSQPSESLKRRGETGCEETLVQTPQGRALVCTVPSAHAAPGTGCGKEQRSPKDC